MKIKEAVEGISEIKMKLRQMIKEVKCINEIKIKSRRYK